MSPLVANDPIDGPCFSIEDSLILPGIEAHIRVFALCLHRVSNTGMQSTPEVVRPLFRCVQLERGTKRARDRSPRNVARKVWRQHLLRCGRRANVIHDAIGWRSADALHFVTDVWHCLDAVDQISGD